MALQGRIVHLWVLIESNPRRCGIHQRSPRCDRGFIRVQPRPRSSTYLSDFLLRHAMFHIGLVQEDQETSSHQTLVVVSRDSETS